MVLCWVFFVLFWGLEQEDHPSQKRVKEEDGEDRQKSSFLLYVLADKDRRCPCGPEKGHDEKQDIEPGEVHGGQSQHPKDKSSQGHGKNTVPQHT
mmetsp:Transcript_6851/g.15648  ORF Transcript_6851/g.15648 Transcript_6851/m.15648 type:complete len:95 (-) Transcript_6851:574-858(-)